MITVIIPIHNIKQRGFHRLDLALYSLKNQPCKVIVCDSSDPDQTKEIAEISAKYKNARHLKVISEEFNKPLLHNSGVIISDTNWVLCADADFCYQRGFIEYLHQFCTDPNNFTIKLIHVSDNHRPTKQNVDDWDWANKLEFPFGKDANALQLFSKEWFTFCGGYDEQMTGWGAMDNDMVNRAKIANMNVRYLAANEGPEVMHIWHKQEKSWQGQDMKKNWEIRDNRKGFKVN